MISSSLEGEAGGAGFQVEGSEKQRAAGMLPPESGRFFLLKGKLQSNGFPMEISPPNTQRCHRHFFSAGIE